MCVAIISLLKIYMNDSQKYFLNLSQQDMKFTFKSTLCANCVRSNVTHNKWIVIFFAQYAFGSPVPGHHAVFDRNQKTAQQRIIIWMNDL